MAQDHSQVQEDTQGSTLVVVVLPLGVLCGEGVLCRGPAPVDPGNSKVGTASASLEKYIFNHRYIEKLEMDSVVGKSVEKKRLNNLVYVE